MNPRHLKQVPDDRKAIAPYNFVELPNKVVPAQVQCNSKLRDNDRYYSDRYTGKIICTLKTESPLYIRCGLNPVDFAAFSDKPNEELEAEQRKKKAEFFMHPSNLHPVLPGSSLRGMLRTLVEIISFSKIERVSDQQKFFFRAVAADKDDPLSNPYKERLKNVNVGYLEFEFDKKQKQNKWFVRPAQEIEGQLFREVKEENIQDSLPSLILMKKASYIPQYIQISFEVTAESINVSEDLTRYSQQGWLVTSGNMLENMLEETTERKREELLRKKGGRKYHYIIGEADRSARRHEISPNAIRDYRDALTNFQKGKEKPFKDNSKNRFDEKMGVLQEGLPIFYCEPQNKQPMVTLFGQSPNFRIPYSPNNDGQAASAVDFIPKEVGESEQIDLANAIFGFVRGKKDKTERDATKNSKEKREQSRAGRIFVSDAKYKPGEEYKTDEDDIWITKETITPQILASPKPTTFQHYLVQPKDTQAVKSELKHYGKPITETVIRGHKLYWHKDNVSKDRIQENATEAEIQEKQKQSQYTAIKPIKAGVSFEFKIQFENLTDVEMGALLWILTLAGDDTEKLKMINLDAKEKYRLSLGMGKPLGMGAVAIEYKLVLNERYKNEPKQRYTQLFDGEKWVTSDRYATIDEQKCFLEEFERYIVNNISIEDCPQDFPITANRETIKLKDVPRIKMLLTMLRWDVFPPGTRTRYMEIEKNIEVEQDNLCQPVKETDKTVNEYKCRLVLPTPFQVMDEIDKDNRRLDNSTPPSAPPTLPPRDGGGGSNSKAWERPRRPKS
jgi:CRISPR-associated protein (TIGR03986 family)